MGKVKTKKNNKGTVFLHSFLSVCGHRGDTVEGHSGLKAFFVFLFLFFFKVSFGSGFTGAKLPTSAGLKRSHC